VRPFSRKPWVPAFAGTTAYFFSPGTLPSTPFT
jgi:hypothetical protein